MEEAPVLMAVHRVVGRVEVNHQLARRAPVRGDELLHQDLVNRYRPLPLEPAQRRGAGQRLVSLTRRLHHLIVAKRIVVVQIFVARRHRVHPDQHLNTISRDSGGKRSGWRRVSDVAADRVRKQCTSRVSVSSFTAIPNQSRGGGKSTGATSQVPSLSRVCTRTGAALSRSANARRSRASAPVSGSRLIPVLRAGRLRGLRPHRTQRRDLPPLAPPAVPVALSGLPIQERLCLWHPCPVGRRPDALLHALASSRHHPSAVIIPGPRRLGGPPTWHARRPRCAAANVEAERRRLRLGSAGRSPRPPRGSNARGGGKGGALRPERSGRNVRGGGSMP